MRTHKYYEPIAITASIFSTLLAALFYYLNTEDASLKEKMSGIAVNLLINYFMAKSSLDLEASLIDDKKKIQAITYPLAAALLYTPQTIIAYRDAKHDSTTLAFFAAFATMLSGGTLYMNSLKGLIAFTESSIIPKIKSASTEASELRQTVITNLEILLERLRFSAYKSKELDTLVLQDNKNTNTLIQIALLLAESTPQKIVSTKTAVKTMATVMPQLGVAAVMVYGSFGYDCAVEAALTKYFLSSSPEAAATIALILMSCQFILNIKAAFMLVSAIINTVAATIKYNRLPNDCYLGGTAFKIATCCSPLLALLLTSFSGFTSQNLYSKYCDASKLSFLQFPDAKNVIDYSARAFNGTYAELTMIEGEKEYIKLSKHHEKDCAYLTIMESLSAFLHELKSTPADLLENLLAQLGSDCERLMDPTLFTSSAERHLEEARLLP